MSRFKSIDYFIFIPYLIMSVIGIIMVYSASANIGIQNGGSPSSYFRKQFFFVILSIIIVLLMSRFKITKLRNKRFLSYLEIIFFLVLAGLLVVGTTINGAAGWIRIGSLSIQPAEFVKFFIIIRLANIIDYKQDIITQSSADWWHELWPTVVRTGILIILIFAQPDAGGAAINFAIAFVIFMTSGISWKKALAFLGGGVVFVIAAIQFVLVPLSKTSLFSGSYQLQRIIAFTNPFGHATGAGQQLVNSYYAISNGGLFGVGLGNSVQKTGYLPEPNTDFIMSILTEELGAVGAICVMALLTFIIARTVLIGIRSNNTYQSLVCYGVATYMTIQTLFNMGGVLGVLPITGVTFPFISYGGSSILTLSFCLGLVLNISGRQKRARQTLQTATG
ncbi:FtsW/RodA/SpoVE family cell cycle protein [Lentilactobacillus kisonensis]|uniref:Probable peptidoglycan glycosyltransferase FtsW n=2 Tax=Lentilactobacillus kisonensis TaxID=481722 RepID=H1LCM9_9LACO|nr:FtsW/RodA/SpoVE family cell cycle protein [Lentilactobacillus kisonensis]EHO54008.1 putative stage V sporulation protein E [Lentilactobacillus kisonensis F0435]KRL21530.1 stage V sporulation protein E [Lentilactobacillus kisonensis DSM 19906 = JCM 15041]